MIEIKNLSKSFNGKDYVLENLNCKIKDKAIYGLVGANGAGKSTLLRLINSIYTSDEGSILIDNELAYDNEVLKQKMVFNYRDNHSRRKIFPKHDPVCKIP